MNKISGWGRYPRVNVTEGFPESEEELIKITENHSDSFIARGNGRSYGDSAINRNLTINMKKFNKILEFNVKDGSLVAESGVLISDVIKTFMPKGWFPFVTAGTKYVTLGGAIACDIHGKNHHSDGSFGNYVNWFEILNGENKIIRCAPDENSDLFFWTIGGMGLTGIITKCSIKLKKIENGWMSQKVIVNNSLDETLNSFYDNDNSSYSVAWLDCLSKKKNFGRSVLILGEHAKNEQVLNQQNLFPKFPKQILSIPFNFPSFILNNVFISFFNNIYFFLHRKQKSSIVHWDKYFYPLDFIKDWNRLYGKKGFFQFQCVLPLDKSKKGLSELLNIIQNESSGSFLAVLKKFGKGSGCLSFPRDGFTLALDFKISKKNILAAKKLTNIVSKFNGSIYLAKDSLLHSSDLEQMIGKEKIGDFQKLTNKKCVSEQSIRLKL